MVIELRSIRLRNLILLLVHTNAIVGIISLFGTTSFFWFFFFVYLTGIFLDFKSVYPIRRLILNTIGVILSLYFLSRLSLENLVSPLSNTLLLLIAIKSLEKKEIRDLYQILLLSLFAVSLSTLHNLNITFLIVLLIELFLGLTSLIFINLYRNVGDQVVYIRDVAHFFRVSVVLFILIATFSVPFFIVLPRSQSPIFSFLSKPDGLKSGISDSVSLGKVGEIQMDNTVAFRVYGLPVGLDSTRLYWRVSVFDKYTGKEWISTRDNKVEIHRGNENSFSYTIFLEPTFAKYLPLLDYPAGVTNLEGIEALVYIQEGNVFRLSRTIDKPIKYVGFSSDTLLYEDPPEHYLDVPKNIPNSILKLAQEISENAKTSQEKVRRVVDYFGAGGFSYSLRLEKYENDPLEYFLLVSKKGNCEYYASATALLLRIMGVPARVVGGYRGAIWNNLGNYYIVTNSMAHVWVEAFVNGSWIKLDTTPPYVPPGIRKVSWFSLLSDAVMSFWLSKVVGYSIEDQISMLTSFSKKLSIGFNKHALLNTLKNTFLAILIISLLYVLYIFFRGLRRTPTNAYYALVGVLKKETKMQVDANKPHQLLKQLEHTPLKVYADYIVNLYLRYKYSQYRIYNDEIEKAYESLAKIRRIIKRENQ